MRYLESIAIERPWLISCAISDTMSFYRGRNIIVIVAVIAINVFRIWDAHARGFEREQMADDKPISTFFFCGKDITLCMKFFMK